MKHHFFMLDEEGINNLVEQIAEKLKLTSQIPSNLKEDELLSIDEAASLIKLTKPTIYGLVHKREIPFSKKGKRLYFLRSELMNWISSGRKASNSEMQSKVNEYLSKNPLV